MPLILFYSDEPCFQKNYPSGGPLLQVINMWTPLITKVVVAYDTFINSIPDNSNDLKTTWDKKLRLKALLDTNGLDEDLNICCYSV